ncbi:MAG: hypothetical protein JOZ65_00130 [Chloroflexi bacterium]|nr:hypothetical protein [Chloroflexota bacterium]
MGCIGAHAIGLERGSDRLISLNEPLLYRDLKGIAGYVLDLLDIGRMRFCNPHALTKFFIINSLRQRTGARTFIEAGTNKGTTAARCARVFERVVTVELDADLARTSTRFLRNRSNVLVVCGDALSVIPRVIESQRLDRILVFLDAHAPLWGTANGGPPEPALDELNRLADYKDRICGVIVDDFRNFGAAPGFPSRSCLVSAAEAFCADGDFTFNVHLDQLIIERKRP